MLLSLTADRHLTIERPVRREHLEPVAQVLKADGYIPFGDHFIPPEVPWEEFKYYRNRLNAIIDAAGR